MKPKDLKDARHKLDVGLNDFARRIDVKPGRLKEWEDERSDREPHKMLAFIMRVLTNPESVFSIKDGRIVFDKEKR